MVQICTVIKFVEETNFQFDFASMSSLRSHFPCTYLPPLLHTLLTTNTHNSFQRLASLGHQVVQGKEKCYKYFPDV